MEKIIASGVVADDRVGNRMTIVCVNKLENGEEYVTVSVAYGPSGSAMGRWNIGFIDNALPSESERNYFCHAFKIDKNDISMADFFMVDRLYMEARRQMEKAISGDDGRFLE